MAAMRVPRQHPDQCCPAAGLWRIGSASGWVANGGNSNGCATVRRNQLHATHMCEVDLLCFGFWKPLNWLKCVVLCARFVMLVHSPCVII